MTFGAKITIPPMSSKPTVAAQFGLAEPFVSLTLGSIDRESQGHCVPVFFEHFESAVELYYFHAQIIAPIDLLVNRISTEQKSNVALDFQPAVAPFVPTRHSER